MSLDVYLSSNKCEHCGRSDNQLYSANITHNLAEMAIEAGIYEIVWRPEENGITKAEQLIEPLSNAIAEMEADPARFEKFNAGNDWGLYIQFLPWLKEYLIACIKNPDSNVSSSR
jgi:hypothetical protein